MAARTRTTVAGAIIAAVADLLHMLLIGWYDEDSAYTTEHTGERW